VTENPHCRLHSTTVALVAVIGILSGCGDDTPASTTPTSTTADTQPAVQPPPSAKTSAERQRALDGIISDYLSKLIDIPSSVRDPATATATINTLASEVGDAQATCRAAVRKVSKVIDRTDLSGTAKRKQVLDAMLPVYGDC